MNKEGKTMESIFLSYHLNKYPKMQSIDKIKLIYQATYGSYHYNHVDLSYIKQRTLKEIQDSTIYNQDDNIYEWISENYLRFNLIPLKDNMANLEKVINFFYHSSTISKPLNINKNSLENNLLYKNLIFKNLNYFLKKEEYQDYDGKAVNHSCIYKENYFPHYLLVKKEYLSLYFKTLQLKHFMNKLSSHTITSLEGKCASGKTTLAESLKENYTIIHTDDFFLSKDKKTKERLNEIGGNIDYELLNLTLNNIKNAWKNNKNIINIKVFDCKTSTYYEKTIYLKDKVLLEGVYSTHPYFRNQIDKIAFLFISTDEQLERINNRVLKDRFINEWIPLENKYFDNINILSITNIII